jgi:hypothetical protein
LLPKLELRGAFDPVVAGVEIALEVGEGEFVSWLIFAIFLALLLYCIVSKMYHPIA